MKQHNARTIRFARHGMTLIELLAAAALAALLLVTVSAVIGSLSAQRRALFQDGIAEPWRQPLVNQLRWDLANARWMHCQPEQLALTGFGARDFESGQPTQRPCRVSYRIRRQGTAAVLLREERHLDSPSSGDARNELVCVGVSSLEIQPLEQSGADGVDRVTPIPRRLRFILHGDGPVPLLDQLFFFERPPAARLDRSGPAETTQDSKGLRMSVAAVSAPLPVEAP